jgi:hypothetical protein
LGFFITFNKLKMKKILLSATLLFAVATFAQKEELKTLKKIYAKSTISDKDLVEYKKASSALSAIASEESDKVYAKFYSVMYPTVELASKGDKATPLDQMKLYTPEFITEYGATINETIDFEKKSGNKIYTDDLIKEKKDFSEGLKAIAFKLNEASKFKEASTMFYSLYLFDKKNEGSALENAAILAVQSEDYIFAEKIYAEYKNSDYLENGTTYFAINKATDLEETMPNREYRLKMIGLGSHEKPREEKNALKKPDVYKVYALIVGQNGNIEKSLKAYEDAIALNPTDESLKISAAQLYFNEGYKALAEDEKLVADINSNLENKAKYDELIQKRKLLFKANLPHFEKAYSLNSKDENTKQILKMSYDILGMKEKLASVK